MSELNDSSELQIYSSACLYVISAITLPPDYVDVVLGNFFSAIKSSSVSIIQHQCQVAYVYNKQSWRIRLHALPALVVFFYRNLITISPNMISQAMDVLLECLADENVEVREMASKALSGIVRCSQRQSIIPLKASRFAC
jgi:proteasome activator subunit 4